MNKLLVLVLLTWVVEAATVRTVKVREDGVGAYQSLNLAEAGEDAVDLTATDEILVISIEGDWSVSDTTAVTWSGFTTDATRYLVITNTSSYHYGQPDYPGAHKLLVTDATAFVITEKNVRVYGVQIEVDGTTAANRHCMTVNIGSGTTSNHIIERCVLIGDDSSMYQNICFQNDVDSDNTWLVNNVVWGRQTAGATLAAINLLGTNNFLYNNTVYSATRGVSRGAGTVTAHNNLVHAPSGNDWQGTISGDNNSSQDATIPTGSNNEINVTTPNFYDAATGKLWTSYYRFVGRGKTDPGSGMFSDDVLLQTRVEPWDIGAFEHAAGPYVIGPLAD